MKTVGDIMDLILSNQKVDDNTLSQHATDLPNARELGSTTEIGLDEVPRETPVREVAHVNVKGNCKCYKFDYDMGGRLGAMPFKAAFKKYGTVHVRNGRHGTELYVNGDIDDVEGCDENSIYVIVGTHVCHNGDHVEAVFTWHPGQPLRTLEDGITDNTAVKVDIK